MGISATFKGLWPRETIPSTSLVLCTHSILLLCLCEDKMSEQVLCEMKISITMTQVRCFFSLGSWLNFLLSFSWKLHLLALLPGTSASQEGVFHLSLNSHSQETFLQFMRQCVHFWPSRFGLQVGVHPIVLKASLLSVWMKFAWGGSGHVGIKDYERVVNVVYWGSWWYGELVGGKACGIWSKE